MQEHGFVVKVRGWERGTLSPLLWHYEMAHLRGNKSCVTNLFQLLSSAVVHASLYSPSFDFMCQNEPHGGNYGSGLSTPSPLPVVTTARGGNHTVLQLSFLQQFPEWWVLANDESLSHLPSLPWGISVTHQSTAVIPPPT